MSANDYCLCSRKESTALPVGELFVLQHSVVFVQGNSEEQCAEINVLGFDFCIKFEGNQTTLYLNKSIVVAINIRPALSNVTETSLS